MVLKYRYLGKGVTDSNGIAHMTEDAEGQTVTGYTGTGRGLTDIIASTDDSTAISDSSIQSEIYDVYDCMFYDSCTTGTPNSEWWKSGSSLNVESSNNGITLTNSTSNIYYFSPNKYGTSKSSMTDLVEWNDFCVEFTYVSMEGNHTIQFRDVNSITSQRALNSLDLQGGEVFKIKYSNGVISATVDNNPITFTGNANTDTMFRFSINTGNFTFKDFKLYPI